MILLRNFFIVFFFIFSVITMISCFDWKRKRPDWNGEFLATFGISLLAAVMVYLIGSGVAQLCVGDEYVHYSYQNLYPLQGDIYAKQVTEVTGKSSSDTKVYFMIDGDNGGQKSNWAEADIVSFKYVSGGPYQAEWLQSQARSQWVRDNCWFSSGTGDFKVVLSIPQGSVLIN